MNLQAIGKHTSNPNVWLACIYVPMAMMAFYYFGKANRNHPDNANTCTHIPVDNVTGLPVWWCDKCSAFRSKVPGSLAYDEGCGTDYQVDKATGFPIWWCEKCSTFHTPHFIDFPESWKA